MTPASETELGRIYRLRGTALNSTYYTRADGTTLKRLVKRLSKRSTTGLTTEELRTLRAAEKALRGERVVMIRHTRYKTTSGERKEMTGYVETPLDYNFREVKEPPGY